MNRKGFASNREGLTKRFHARRRFFIGLTGVWIFFFLPVLSVQAFDFSTWDALVKKYVVTTVIDGVELNAVAYKKLKSDPAFAGMVKRLETASLAELKTREEKLSFWINVYNILAVKMIVDHYPIKSIKDVGSIFNVGSISEWDGVFDWDRFFDGDHLLDWDHYSNWRSFFKSVWTRPAGKVAGKKRTLNDIEHEILRKMGEPRIHMAIVCASVSCPDLRKEAYSPGRLDHQLDDQVKQFLANPGKGMRIDLKNNRVYLSSIFDWFKEDFESQSGVIAFISRYVSPAGKNFLENGGFKVTYFDYNWKLNEI
ncbi:MAG: DUF547 domain-containing protein [Nitrospinaceae bacterium]